MRQQIEFAVAWMALKGMGFLPRRLARVAGCGLATLAYWLRPPLRRAARLNLRLAFPEWSESDRKGVAREMVRQLGWMGGEFSQFPKYSRKNIGRVVVLDGYENFAAALQKGKGVLFLTGHMSAWELAPFAHALYGHPLHFLVRPIENARLDALVNRYRCLSGNQPIDKNHSVRAMLRVLREGGTVGILADQNTSLEEGVFVNFFGVPAATTTGLARLALLTGAAVVPGFLRWDRHLRKYRLRFEPAIEIARGGNEGEDVRENTARFTRVIEDYARAHPDQWLWVHKRWKTRPAGEKPIYPS